MCWESFDVVRFDLGPLVQGQTMMPLSRLLLVLLLVKRGWPSLKVSISSLLLLPEVWDVKLTLNSTFLLPGGRSYHCSGLVISRPARRREIIICTMCVSACVDHAVFSETTTVTHFW